MNRKKKRLLHAGIAAALIAVGLVGAGALTASKETLERAKPPAPLPVVRTVQVRTGLEAIIIKGEGTVVPLLEINLVPEVKGKVLFASPSLMNGAEFRKGQTLLRIDPVDYELAVTLARANVKESESQLRIAQEEAAIAREEWQLHRSDGVRTVDEPPPLVAKQPQLAAAQARLEAHRADLKKALLNLERTEIKASFNGRVSEKSVDTGQYVSVGQVLATIYCTDAVEIVVPMTIEDLKWFHVPGFTPGDGPGSPTVVRASMAGQELSWQGNVLRAEGKLDERTRMVNVVVRVDEPYARMPPLAVGLFVTVDIHGRSLPDTAVLPKSALRDDERVWIVDDKGLLSFRDVELARMRGEEIIVKSGVENGELVVTSPLKAVTDGMTVIVAEKEGNRP